MRVVRMPGYGSRGLVLATPPDSALIDPEYDDHREDWENADGYGAELVREAPQ